MGTIVETEIERDGKRYIRRVQLLADNEEELDQRGVLNIASGWLAEDFQKFLCSGVERQVRRGLIAAAPVCMR